jgi:TPR repeat protein
MNFKRTHPAAIATILTLSVLLAPVEAPLAQSSMSNTILNAQQNNLASANTAIQRKDYAKARMILEILIASGDSDAMMKLGELHEKGLGGAKDPQAAFDLYKKAHLAGHPSALNALIKIDKVNYYSGRIFKEQYSPSKLMHCPGSSQAIFGSPSDLNVYDRYDDDWAFDGVNLYNTRLAMPFQTKKTYESHVLKFGGFIFNFDEKIIIWKYLGTKLISKCTEKIGG